MANAHRKHVAHDLACITLTLLLTVFLVASTGCRKRVVRSTAFDSAQFQGYNTDEAPRYETRNINPHQEKKRKSFFGGLIDSVEEAGKKEEPPPRKPGYRAF